jgi:large subunit ribosomal protein L10
LNLAAEKKIQEWKKATVNNLAQLMGQYRVLALTSLHKVRAIQVQELRKKFRDEAVLTCAKNTLMREAMKRISEKKGGIAEMEKQLQGSNLVIFTDINPVKLAIRFGKSKVKLSAKAGDVSPSDILIPEGNTGMSPGPILSELAEIGLPVKIEGGSIWVTDDTTLVRKGDTITDRVASALTKLGIKPIETSMKLDTAYEDGVIYQAETLKIDLAAFERDLKDAATYAFNFAVNASYPTDESINSILAKATAEAKCLALNAELFEPEILPAILGKGHSQMLALAGKLAEKDKIFAS